MKKLWIPILAALLLAAVLFVPILKGPYEDGGSREYAALTYKIVDWNRLSADGVYEATKIYWFPDNFKSIDELWEQEAPEVEHRFIAKVLELSGDSVLVQPVEGEDELRSSDKISFSLPGLAELGIAEGSFVEVYYDGLIMETYPAQIHALKCDLTTNLKHMPYPGTWLDKETARSYTYEGNSIREHFIISEIYADCIIGYTVIPLPHEYKLNTDQGKDWCIGDQVACTYQSVWYDDDGNRAEADLVGIDVSDFEIDPNACYKPVIYLYPEEETEVSVKLNLDGKLTCTYPVYENGWQVTAAPDGTLIDAKGQTYNYLYWEGETSAQWDMERGFCVKGEDTAAFLESALEQLGLNRREANEFIVYWLPLMEQKPYNIIAFQTDAYTDAAALDITPAPDTLIRVFMTWQGAESYVNLEPQELTAPERSGFTVIEWGGAQIG